MATLDIFNNNAFSTTTITERINTMPFVPGKAGQLGIFEEEGIPTTSVAIEEDKGVLSLIPNVPRGGPATQNVHPRRKLRNLTVPHLPLEDAVYPGEIQNVRAFGSDSELEGVQAVVDRRLQGMNYKHDATVEYGRIGAIKGVILDYDGSTVIYNLFTEFGVAQDTVDFDLGTAGTDLLGKLVSVRGLIEDELGMMTYETVHGFAGKTWWQKYVTHPKIVTAYQYFQATGQRVDPLREDLRYRGFTFGDVTIEQYRGKVAGIPFIADNEAYFFPTGVPALFKTYFAPADFMETVNTIGLPRYAKAAPDRDFNRFVKLHTQSNPLTICTRPKVLIKGTTST